MPSFFEAPFDAPFRCAWCPFGIAHAPRASGSHAEGCRNLREVRPPPMKMRRRARGTRRMIEFIISDTALSTNFQHPVSAFDHLLVHSRARFERRPKPNVLVILVLYNYTLQTPARWARGPRRDGYHLALRHAAPSSSPTLATRRVPSLSEPSDHFGISATISFSTVGAAALVSYGSVSSSSMRGGRTDLNARGFPLWKGT